MVGFLPYYSFVSVLDSPVCTNPIKKQAELIQVLHRARRPRPYNHLLHCKLLGDRSSSSLGQNWEDKPL